MTFYRREIRSPGIRDPGAPGALGVEEVVDAERLLLHQLAVEAVLIVVHLGVELNLGFRWQFLGHFLLHPSQDERGDAGAQAQRARVGPAKWLRSKSYTRSSNPPVARKVASTGPAGVSPIVSSSCSPVSSLHPKK